MDNFEKNSHLERLFSNIDAFPEETSSKKGGILCVDNLFFIRRFFGWLTGNFVSIKTEDSRSHLVSKRSLEAFLIRNKDLSQVDERGSSKAMLQSAIDRVETAARMLPSFVTKPKDLDTELLFLQVQQNGRIPILATAKDDRFTFKESVSQESISVSRFRRFLLRNCKTDVTRVSHTGQEALHLLQEAVQQAQKKAALNKEIRDGKTKTRPT